MLSNDPDAPDAPGDPINVPVGNAATGFVDRDRRGTVSAGARRLA